MMYKGAVALLIFCSFLLCSCQNNSERPGSELKFFHQVYEGLSDEDIVANAFMQTTDGGFLLAGTAYLRGEPQQMVLIKTDALGNLIWQRGYSDYFGSGFRAEAKTLVEGPGGYIVGALLDDGGVKSSVLFLVDQNGLPSETNRFEVGSATGNYIISSTTLGPTGLLVAGTTDDPLAPDSRGGTDGFLTLISGDLTGSLMALDIEVFGLAGNEEIVGAYEVADPAFIGRDGSKYLVFGTTTGNTAEGNRNFFYTGFNEDFMQTPGINLETIIADGSGNQSGAKLKSFNNEYWLIGNSNGVEIYLVGWRFGNSSDVDWGEIANYRNIAVVSGQNEVGKSLAFGPQGRVVVGDVLLSGTRQELAIASLGSDSNVDLGWPITFGNEAIAYEATDVLILEDGSVMTLGTILQNLVKKMVLIKVGPNGEKSPWY